MDQKTVAIPRRARPWWPLLVALLAIPSLGIAGCDDTPETDAPPSLLASEWDSVDAWIEHFGDASQRHPRAARAFAVFQQLRPYFDDAGRRLVLLDSGELGRGSAPTAFAAALPDGNIVLNTAGLDLCYDGVSDRVGDSRLALVLAHELAHLYLKHTSFLEAAAMLPFATDDIHQELLDTLGSDATEARKLELMADRNGLLGMAMVGYDPEAILGGEGSFFGEWVGTAAGQLAYQDESHPTPDARERYARSNLRDAAGLAAVFHAGVEAYQSATGPDDYERAIDAFEEVKQEFASREVLSNLGLSYYQLAAYHLGRCEGMLVTRWRMPVALDEETLLDRAVNRGSERSKCYETERYAESWSRARDALDEAHRRDESYGKAILNFVALHMLDDRPLHALGIADEGARLFPDDPRFLLAARTTEVAYALDRGLASEVQRAALDDLHRRYPDDADVAFNAAQAHWLAGDFDRAEALWRDFLLLVPDGVWAELVRSRLGEDMPNDQEADRLAK